MSLLILLGEDATTEVAVQNDDTTWVAQERPTTWEPEDDNG